MNNLDDITKVLDFGSKEEKIKTLESLSDVNNIEIIQTIISRLDDDDIQVRGEAFSALMLNENKISDILIKNLKSPNKNIAGFTALILANRLDANAIPEIIKLTHDQSSLVRACALGALGHLRAKEAKHAIHDCLLDASMEVRKSALHAIINLDEPLTEKEIKEISMKKDAELDALLVNVKKESGPKGI